MNKQEFIDLGLTEEQAAKAETASKKELETYIPKTRFDEVNTAKAQAEKDLNERDKQIDTLKKSTGDNEDLKKKIETLQEQNKTATKEYETKMKNLQLNNAIKLALTGKAQDEDLVAGLFDKTKLILGEDGKITGLTEQLTTLQKDKAFLFKTDDQNQQQQQQKPGFNVGGNTPNQQQSQQPMSLKEALAAKFTQSQTQ